MVSISSIRVLYYYIGVIIIPFRLSVTGMRIAIGDNDLVLSSLLDPNMYVHPCVHVLPFLTFVALGVAASSFFRVISYIKKLLVFFLLLRVKVSQRDER